jgi:hypothetical protein
MSFCKTCKYKRNGVYDCIANQSPKIKEHYGYINIKCDKRNNKESYISIIMTIIFSFIVSIITLNFNKNKTNYEQ